MGPDNTLTIQMLWRNKSTQWLASSNPTWPQLLLVLLTHLTGLSSLFTPPHWSLKEPSSHHTLAYASSIYGISALGMLGLVCIAQPGHSPVSRSACSKGLSNARWMNEWMNEAELQANAFTHSAEKKLLARVVVHACNASILEDWKERWLGIQG